MALIHGVGKNSLADGEVQMYCVIRPNTGRSPKLENIVNLLRRFRPATLEEAEKAWKEQYSGNFN